MINNYKCRIMREVFMDLKYLKRSRELEEERKLDLFEKECYETEEFDFDLRKIKLVLFK